ncbi:MAG: hypothetical protein ABI016_10595, partial [Chthoniobacterales bacterium]
KDIDLLVPQLRARRLDMFAEGLQDWIGQPVTRLFGGRQDPRNFHGWATLKRLAGGRDQNTSCKVTGRLLIDDRRPPQNMAIVDPQERVVGIARSSSSDRFLNWLLYGGRMPNGHLTGYIRNYDPASCYFLRAASSDGISTQQIAIAPLSRSP